MKLLKAHEIIKIIKINEIQIFYIFTQTFQIF